MLKSILSGGHISKEELLVGGVMGETVMLGSTGLVLNLNGLSFSKPTGADKPDHAVLMKIIL